MNDHQDAEGWVSIKLSNQEKIAEEERASSLVAVSRLRRMFRGSRVYTKRILQVATFGVAIAVCANSERYRITTVMVAMYVMTRQAGGSHFLAFQVAMGAARTMLYSSPVFGIARAFMQ